MESQENKDKVVSRFNEIQQEILKIGWSGILEKYHPDCNIDESDSFDVFKMYKEIYLSMKKRMIVDPQ